MRIADDNGFQARRLQLNAIVAQIPRSAYPCFAFALLLVLLKSPPYLIGIYIVILSLLHYLFIRCSSCGRWALYRSTCVRCRHNR